MSERETKNSLSWASVAIAVPLLVLLIPAGLYLLAVSVVAFPIFLVREKLKVGRERKRILALEARRPRRWPRPTGPSLPTF